MALGAEALQYVLSVLFVGLATMLMVEGVREGRVARDRTIAMLLIFAFNILFWMFYEQAGNSFTFLADQIVNLTLSPASSHPSSHSASGLCFCVVAILFRISTS